MSLYCYHCMTEITEKDKFCAMCGKSNSSEVPSHHLIPGTLLNGKFLVGAAIGEGGFGITYIGRDINLDMRVAIKEFFPNGFVSRSNTVTARINDITSQDKKDFFEKGKERFLSEARILARFSGEPGIVDVRDFFEENNTAYIIMEYLDGIDLKSYLKKNLSLTPENAVKMLFPVMQSLKKVHAQGLIHRDISPDNIMVLKNTVKLLDFGAARSVSAEANKSLSVMLKPGYAPEEQYRSKGNQGPWTDVYAICATLYKCITGITPDDSTQRVYKDEVKLPSAMGFRINPVIENAIMRGMAVHQEDRFRSVDELIDALSGKPAAMPAGDKTASLSRTDNNRTVYRPQAVSSNNKNTGGRTGNTNGYGVSAMGMIAEKEKKSGKKPAVIAGIVIALIVAIFIFVFAVIIPSASAYTSEAVEESSEAVQQYSAAFDTAAEDGISAEG